MRKYQEAKEALIKKETQEINNIKFRNTPQQYMSGPPIAQHRTPRANSALDYTQGNYKFNPKVAGGGGKRSNSRTKGGPVK